MSTALASISHVPTSWQPKLPDFKMASCGTLSNSLFSLAKTSPKSEIKNQKFKIQVFLQVFNHRSEKKVRNCQIPICGVHCLAKYIEA
jgi:hypothetical protein